MSVRLDYSFQPPHALAQVGLKLGDTTSISFEVRGRSIQAAAAAAQFREASLIEFTVHKLA